MYGYTDQSIMNLGFIYRLMVGRSEQLHLLPNSAMIWLRSSSDRLSLCQIMREINHESISVVGFVNGCR